MVWNAMREPFSVEKMIKEINLLWDTLFEQGLRNTSKSIHIVETKEIVVEKVEVSKPIKKDR